MAMVNYDTCNARNLTSICTVIQVNCECIVNSFKAHIPKMKFLDSIYISGIKYTCVPYI